MYTYRGHNVSAEEMFIQLDTVRAGHTRNDKCWREKRHPTDAHASTKTTDAPYGAAQPMPAVS